MTPLGKKIRQLRADKAVSQKKMASDLNISPAYLSALEHGHRGQPTWALVQKMISYFNLIWDDAEEIELLARGSRPKITLDTSGLSPEAVIMANQLGGNIRRLTPDHIAGITRILNKIPKK
ncbi:MAG: helix-turn-helix domain-containing protein [Emcibacter sp.]|nr:helix-turn-helix domain-containing protein [Emcibacter sp.]